MTIVISPEVGWGIVGAVGATVFWFTMAFLGSRRAFKKSGKEDTSPDA